MAESGVLTEQAILVQVNFTRQETCEDVNELQLLVSSAGVSCMQLIYATRNAPDARYFVGSGKAQEIADAVAHWQAGVVVFNHSLSPAQTRNLERLCQARVIDRTALILDIFAQRARSYEGKLQVELAQLKHLASRLVRGWDNAERQKGGIGLRGPGETRLETDRRLLRVRLTALQQRLGKINQQREQGRKSRQRAAIPQVSLVGYTNAGKSTLFNQLTQAQVYVADQLFATLDPTLRQLQVKGLGTVVFADTVGFIRHLPHDLVAAFKSTLQESRDADLLLHVIDVSDPRHEDTMQQVQQVLQEIEADQVPQLLVFNKIDVAGDTARIEYDQAGMPIAVYISARQQQGLELLLSAITERLSTRHVRLLIKLPPEQAGWRGKLHQHHCVMTEEFDDDGNCTLQLQLSEALWQQLNKQSRGQLENYVVSTSVF